MTAALLYRPEAYSIAGRRLMGRNAAGEAFLRAYFAHKRAGAMWIRVDDTRHARDFAAAARAAGRDDKVMAVGASALSALAEPGTLYCPAPNIGELAWQRASLGDAAWALCGITHTTSSANAMDMIAGIVASPVRRFDALICTSEAVKDNVARVLDAQASFLARRLGAKNFATPQLPVIPLGVHTADFDVAPAERAAARKTLGAEADTLVVLFLGRLSFHAKAHPLAMYLALQRAKIATGKRVLLVECGWHANAAIAKAFADGARLACPGVPVKTLDGRDAAVRRRAWAAADVFVSLADNIQESFGISPLEAMAAGLPCVVADWDGYRDTVRHGTDGFRIPTLMPPAGLGSDLALRHALGADDYDAYIGNVAALTSVDIDAAATAFARLFASAPLRQRMGAAAQKRAREIYDWKHIFARYETLWEAQTAMRLADAPRERRAAHPWPARLDPFHAFARYPTRRLEASAKLALAGGRDAAACVRYVEDLRALAMVGFAKTVLPEPAEIRAVLAAAAGGAKPAAELVACIAAKRRPHVFRALVWLVKLGALKLVA